MGNKVQIELAKKTIANLQDYIELVKVQKKLKTQSVEAQISTLKNSIRYNVEGL